MSRVTAMIRALAQDDSPRSGWVCSAPGVPIEPREVFIVGVGWVAIDGSSLSGWTRAGRFSIRPWLLNRWRLRRAVAKWAKRRSVV